MKKILLSLVCMVAMSASAQQYMRIWSAGSYTQLNLTEAGDMPVDNGSTITIGGLSYPVAAIDSITLGARVHIKYNGTEAKVNIPDLVQGVTAEVNGADVVVTNTNTAQEMELVLSGVSQSGSFTYNGQYKTTLILDGLNLKSDKTAAINIQCGKRIDMIMTEGSSNMLEDCAGGTQKAALYCRGHLELAGAGTLTVKGNTAHAIGTKEYLIVKKSVEALKIIGAEKDGMHIGQYYQQNGSTVTITGNKGEAIQVEAITLDDGVTLDASKELNGQCIIKGGSITASATSDDCDVLKSDGDMTISGGTLNLRATGAGARCIKTDGDMTINQDSGTTLITLFANGNKYDDGTGDTSRSRLGKVDGNLLLDAGTMNGTVEGKAKGMKVVGTLTWNKTGGAIHTGMAWEAGSTVVK